MDVIYKFQDTQPLLYESYVSDVLQGPFIGRRQRKALDAKERRGLFC